MDADKLEQKYLEYIRREGSILLLSSEYALQLLDDCEASDARFLGVEAFRLFDNGGIQPAMSYSNVSFGTAQDVEGELHVELGRRLHSAWIERSDAIKATKALIEKGTADGYPWYEVSLEHPQTGEPLFFRRTESSELTAV